MHETTNQRGSTFLLHIAASVLRRPIYTYHHGHSFNQAPSKKRKTYQADQSTYLLFHGINKEFASGLGYLNQYVIGFPKFYKEWINLVSQYDASRYHGQKIVVIYSRPAKHVVYMDGEKYISLMVESYRVIRRCMGNVLIVIKPHPREDTRFIRELIKENNLLNIEISHEQAGVLAKNALLTISFYTAAILDSLSLGVPSVEFYKEAKNFRKSELLGSPYKLLGVDSVKCEVDLEQFVQGVVEGNYNIPTIIHEISTVKDIDFLEIANLVYRSILNYLGVRL